MLDASPPVRIGDRIADRYVVERVLGRGGMGIVVAARHVELHQLFAIKFLLPEATRDSTNTERLLREARAAARLASVHVARVSDVGRTASGEPYLVMEYLEGLDLQQLLEAQGAIPAADAAYYVAQACDAVAEAHAAGIVHRDLKPANLFVTRRPDGAAMVKVLDFGIAKEDAGLAAASMTTTGTVLGSPVYMAPEQLRSAKSASPASDIWALGVTLYELTTGVIPYDVGNVTELIASILTESPVPPSSRRPEVPPAMEGIIMRCLQRDPAARFGDARELAAALAPFVERANPWGALPQPMPRGGSEASTRGEVAMIAAQTAAGTSRSIPRARRTGTLSVGIGMGALLTVGVVGVIALVYRTSAPPSGASSAASEQRPTQAATPLGPTADPEPTVRATATVVPSDRPAPTVSPSASAPPAAASSARAPARPPPRATPRPTGGGRPSAPPAATGWGSLL